MWASTVLEGQISANASAGFRQGLVGVEIDFLVFDLSPEPFDEDRVPPCALAIHQDGDLCLLQLGSKVDGSELRSLFRVEDFRPAMTGECLLDRLDAEVRFHRD